MGLLNFVRLHPQLEGLVTAAGRVMPKIGYYNIYIENLNLLERSDTFSGQNFLSANVLSRMESSRRYFELGFPCLEQASSSVGALLGFLCALQANSCAKLPSRCAERQNSCRYGQIKMEYLMAAGFLLLIALEKEGPVCVQSPLKCKKRPAYFQRDVQFS